jgi:hypothetical protein
VAGCAQLACQSNGVVPLGVVSCQLSLLMCAPCLLQDILTSEAGAAPAVSADSGDEDEEDDKYAAVSGAVAVGS